MAGSPYFGGGSSGGASPYFGGKGKGGASKKSGGIIGDIEKGAHWVAKKAGIAAHDVKSIPGGLIATGEGLATHPIRTVEQVGKSTLQTVEHPLRDPFMTALTIGGLLSGVGSVAGRAAAVGDALEEGSTAAAVRAALKSPAPKARLLDLGDGKPVVLHPSKNPAVRAAQSAYDKTLERAAKTNPEGKLAAHANRRAGGSLSETGRYQQRIREAPANALEAAGNRLGRGKGVPAKLQQAALRLTSENSTAEEAARYHLEQAAKGVSPKENLRQAKIYQAVHAHGLLTKDESGNVVVDAGKYPDLAKVDAQVARGQSEVDQIAKQHGQLDEAGAKARVDAPGRIRTGGEYVAPTPGKAGVSPALERATVERDRIARLHGRALERETVWKQEQPAAIKAVAGRIGGPSVSTGNPYRERIVTLGHALDVAQQKVDRISAAVEKRKQPTGIVGGETARPGRGFVSYKTVEQKAPKSGAASSAGPVVGVAKPFIAKKAFTGHGLEHGLVPDNTTRIVARHMRDAYRYVNTDQLRRNALDTGADARRTSRDVLVRIPGEKAGKISNEVNAELGRSHITTDELAGHEAAYTAFMQSIIPGIMDKFTADKAQAIGTKAPEGYKWVDRGVLGDLAKLPAGARGRIARSADNVNSAVTAATVYFKIGHVGTRVLTNASTNIIQGSAKPLELAKSVGLWKELSPLERQQALAAAGQHGFASMPHEGASKVGQVATKGANWWAKHADAPFRFNGIAYEARKAGFDTPAKFRDLLEKLQDPSGLDAKEAARIDGVAKRANREGIAYDRLSATERQFISRAVWFYPWLRGTVGFAWNTLAEHPLKANVLGQAGVAGRKRQETELGDLPSYEQGLFKLAGGSKPLVADFSTFSPFATPADITDAIARPSQLSGFLNPVYGATDQLINGQNQFGSKSAHPVTDALASLLATTPEAQVATAILHRHQDQSKRMFHTTPWSAALRTLLGPGTPRRVNLTAAHSAASRERAGR